MRVVCFNQVNYQPASHEDPQKPGALKKVLLTYRNLIRGRVQMINWAKLLPKKSFRPHLHEDMEEIFIILTGKVRLSIDKEERMLQKGDAAVIPCNKVHKMTNVGNEEVEYIVVGITQKGRGKTVVV